VPIVAEGIAFDTSELSLPAEGPATIAFDNRDSNIPHNVAIYTEAGGEAIFQGEIITGPAQVEYTLDPPSPGTYYFQCDVHPPQMNGTVTVG
jgi:plastocyanin